MKYKFTNSAEQALEIANDLAAKLGHNYIGTEHILYGLTQEQNGVACKALENQGVTSSDVLKEIEELVGISEKWTNRRYRIYRIYTKNKKSFGKCFCRGS